MDKWQKAHMEVAGIYGSLSTATRLKVGCVIVKNDRIISIGYNGMPAGWNNECEDLLESYDDRVVNNPLDRSSWEYNSETKKYTSLKTKPEVLHAETNAIAKLARSSESGEHAELYCTHAPCIDCAKLIYQSGISKVYYSETYRNDMGVVFLQSSGIEVTRIT